MFLLSDVRLFLPCAPTRTLIEMSRALPQMLYPVLFTHINASEQDANGLQDCPYPPRMLASLSKRIDFPQYFTVNHLNDSHTQEASQT